MSKKTQLSEIHWKALNLLEDSSLSRKEVAELCGWSPKHFDFLCAGNIEKCGYTADLFKKEYLKIQAKRAEETKALIKENTNSAQSLIKRVLAELHAKKRLSQEEKKLVSMYTNALSKCTPSVSIGSLSYSYTKGLNPEDLIREFKRLETIASQSFDRRAVSEAEPGRPADVSGTDEPGN